MVRKGINKAVESQIQVFENRRLLSDPEYSKNRTCIFISHKKEDKVMARQIANYIMECGVDVFFDENDPVLSNPETNNDPIKVTNAINKALDNSTHLICIISEKTKESWWVPYEIGFVSNKAPFTSENIRIILIKDIEKLPDYLFLAKRIETTIELDSFLKSASNTSLHLTEEVNTFSEILNKIKSILK